MSVFAIYSSFSKGGGELCEPEDFEIPPSSGVLPLGKGELLRSAGLRPALTTILHVGSRTRNI